MSERQYTQTPDGFDNIPFTDEEQAEWEARQAGANDGIAAMRSNVARQERNRLLGETDYAALPDTPEMSDAMKTYRQALRDLPAQDGWPNVEFPERPSE
tara:strand:+ start:1206 stop:1502 length:297 start_codon:yes stop_codon:yes gene_type:complete